MRRLTPKFSLHEQVVLRYSQRVGVVTFVNPGETGDGGVGGSETRYNVKFTFANGAAIVRESHLEPRCLVRLEHGLGNEQDVVAQACETEDAQCVLPASHQNGVPGRYAEDTPHKDAHGCRAEVLVSQSTIREVAALSEHDRRVARAREIADDSALLAAAVREALDAGLAPGEVRATVEEAIDVRAETGYVSRTSYGVDGFADTH